MLKVLFLREKRTFLLEWFSLVFKIRFKQDNERIFFARMKKTFCIFSFFCSIEKQEKFTILRIFPLFLYHINDNSFCP